MATIMVSIGLLVLSHTMRPYERRFEVNDKSISRPYKARDTISFGEAAGLSLIIPLSLFFAVFWINSIEKRHELLFYTSFLSTCVVISAVVENLKNLIGRLRPDFLDRCKPVYGSCSGNSRVVLEGRKSFPSGHTSIAVGGFVFLVFFVHKEFKLPGLRRKAGGKVALPLCLVLLMVPIVIGTSRVLDNKHFISDVLAGGGIGMIVAILEFKYMEKYVVPDRYAESR